MDHKSIKENYQVKKIGNIFGFDGGNYAGNIYDIHFISPTLRTMQGGLTQPLIIVITK